MEDTINYESIHIKIDEEMNQLKDNMQSGLNIEMNSKSSQEESSNLIDADQMDEEGHTKRLYRKKTIDKIKRWT